MKSYFCARRKEIAAALREGLWPDTCDPVLQAHAADCPDCKDLVLVALTLQQARRETLQEPRLPSSSLVWWRSELRLRNQAVERMTQPIAIAEKIAFITVLLASLGLVIWQWNPIAGWLLSLADPSGSNTFHLDNLWTSTWSAAGWMPILLISCFGIFVLLWGLALLLTAEKRPVKK